MSRIMSRRVFRCKTFTEQHLGVFSCQCLAPRTGEAARMFGLQFETHFVVGRNIEEETLTGFDAFAIIRLTRPSSVWVLKVFAARLPPPPPGGNRKILLLSAYAIDIRGNCVYTRSSGRPRGTIVL